MKKKIFYVMLPVLAMLLSLYATGAHAIWPHGYCTGLRIEKKIQASGQQHSQIAHKQENRKIKNTIRIKAWDTAVAVLVSPWFANRVSFFSSNTYFPALYEHIPCQYSLARNLRGPPSAA